MLSKIRHYVWKNTIRTIYYAIFNSILPCGSQIWGHNHTGTYNVSKNYRTRHYSLLTLQNLETASPFYKSSKILKLKDSIKLQNFLLVHDKLKGQLPNALSNIHQLTCNTHRYNTRVSARQTVILPKVNTMVYGMKVLISNLAYLAIIL